MNKQAVTTTHAVNERFEIVIAGLALSYKLPILRKIAMQPRQHFIII